MEFIPFLILASWGIALTLGVVGVVKRKKNLLLWGAVAAVVGVALTFWLKSLLA